MYWPNTRVTLCVIIAQSHNKVSLMSYYGGKCSVKNMNLLCLHLIYWVLWGVWTDWPYRVIPDSYWNGGAAHGIELKKCYLITIYSPFIFGLGCNLSCIILIPWFYTFLDFNIFLGSPFKRVEHGLHCITVACI